MNLDILLRRGVLAVGIPVCLLGMFHLEENRRGFRAWVAWRVAQEAAGQCYLLAAYEPEPVSRARNFAAAPVVAGSLGDRARWDTLAAGPQPMPGDWRRGRAEDLAPAELPEGLALAARLQAVDGALDDLAAAARRPGCNLRAGGPGSLAAAPFVQDGVPMGRALRLRALVRLRGGDPARALEDVLTGLRVAWQLRDESTFLAQLVRRAWLELMLQPVWEGLTDRAWDGDQLARLQQALEGADLMAGLRRSWSHERCAYALVADALAGSGTGPAGPDAAPDPETRLERWLLVPRGWTYQVLVAQDQFEAQALAALDPQGHRIRADLLEALGARLAAPRRAPYRWAAGAPSWTAAAKLGYTLDLAATQAGLDLARTACALERCRLARGAYPGSLAELTPDFLLREPRDLRTGAVLGYTAGDGGYRLRCAAWGAPDPVPGSTADRTWTWAGSAPQRPADGPGASTTAVPYATTSPTLCTSSPESKRKPRIPLAPTSRARAANRSRAARRVSSAMRA
jgi:hypothetical protein